MPLDDDLKPPDPDEANKARRTRRIFGVGLPSIAAGALALALGVPWWVVVGLLAFVVLGIFIDT